MSAVSLPYDDSNPTPTSSYEQPDQGNYWSSNVYSSQTLAHLEGAAIIAASQEKNLELSKKGSGRMLTTTGRRNDDSSIEDRKRLSESLSFHEYSESVPSHAHALLSLSHGTLFHTADADDHSSSSLPHLKTALSHTRSSTSMSGNDQAPVDVQSPTVPSHGALPLPLRSSAPAPPTYSHQLFNNPGSMNPILPPLSSSSQYPAVASGGYQSRQIQLRPPPGKDDALPQGFKAFDTDDNDVWTAANTITTVTARQMERDGGGSGSGDTELAEEDEDVQMEGDNRGPLTISTPSPVIGRQDLQSPNLASGSGRGRGGKGKGKAAAKAPAGRGRGKNAPVADMASTSPQQASGSGRKRRRASTQSYAEQSDDEGSGRFAIADENEYSDGGEGEGYDHDAEGSIEGSANGSTAGKRTRGRPANIPLTRADRSNSNGPRDPVTGRRIFNGLATNRPSKVTMDDPIQARSYASESKTSRKDVPVAMKRVLKKVAKKRGGEIEEKEEVERIVREAREANTKAARLSRERKKAFLDGLVKENEELKGEMEHWKQRAEDAERELHEWRIGRRTH